MAHALVERPRHQRVGTRSLRALVPILASLFCLLSATQAWAQDDEDTSRYSSVVVQDRLYEPTHELNLSVGTLPLDAFTRGVTLSGSYTLHFTNFFAWEVGQFAYSFPVDTALRSELASLDIQPTPFEIIEWYASSNAIFKPLYWKGSWLNNALAYGELYFNVGFAYARWTRSNRPGLDIGTGIRLFASELVSLKFNARYLVFAGDNIFQQFNVKDELWLGLGTSLTF